MNTIVTQIQPTETNRITKAMAIGEDLIVPEATRIIQVGLDEAIKVIQWLQKHENKTTCLVDQRLTKQIRFVTAKVLVIVELL